MRLKFGCRVGFHNDGPRAPVASWLREAATIVKAILDSKGTDVATIEPTADLASAVSCWRNVSLARWSLSALTSGSRAVVAQGRGFEFDFLHAVFRHVADRHDADQLTFSTTGGC